MAYNYGSAYVDPKKVAAEKAAEQAAQQKRYQDHLARTQEVREQGAPTTVRRWANEDLKAYQDSLQQSQQGALFPEEQPPEPTETEEAPQAAPPPDGAQGPAGGIRTSYTNRGFGLGNAAGVPDAPEQVAMPNFEAQQREVEGKQVLFDQNKIPKPMESNAFNMALMSFGLNLLSGNDYATAFNQAAGHFDQAYGREKRELWAEDLRNQGYDDQEIMSWIESGDQKALTDPAEKLRRAQQAQMEQLNLNKAMYEARPDVIAARAKQAQNQTNFENQLKVAQEQRLQQKADREAFEWEQKVSGVGGGDEKYNEAKAKAENHYTRAVNGTQNYQAHMKTLKSDPFKTNWGIAGRVTNSYVIKMANSMDPVDIQYAMEMNPELTQTILAEKEWLQPVMRKDSGAAVSHSEWNTMSQIYFPRPNDTPEVIARKAQARDISTMSMNPNASQELRTAVQDYQTGKASSLFLVNGQAYMVKGGKTYALDMYK